MNNYYNEIDSILGRINYDVYTIMKSVKDITLDLNLSTVRIVLKEDDTIKVICEPHYSCNINDLPAKILALLADNLIAATTTQPEYLIIALDGIKTSKMSDPPINGMFF